MRPGRYVVGCSGVAQRLVHNLVVYERAGVIAESGWYFRRGGLCGRTSVRHRCLEANAGLPTQSALLPTACFPENRGYCAAPGSGRAISGRLERL